ncbi:MAG: pilin [Proteobacteria bacterium]|nr:pilin [Pseudomonadota bacterium]
MLVSASACKNNVAEYWQDKAAWPPTPADAGCSNVGTAKTLAPSVSAANGEVTVSASPTSSLGLKLGAGTDTLALAPSDGVAPGTLATPAPNQPIGEWICHPGAGGSSTTIAVKYLPSTCRP